MTEPCWRCVRDYYNCFIFWRRGIHRLCLHLAAGKKKLRAFGTWSTWIRCQGNRILALPSVPRGSTSTVYHGTPLSVCTSMPVLRLMLAIERSLRTRPLLHYTKAEAKKMYFDVMYSTRAKVFVRCPFYTKSAHLHHHISLHNVYENQRKFILALANR